MRRDCAPSVHRASNLVARAWELFREHVPIVGMTTWEEQQRRRETHTHELASIASELASIHYSEMSTATYLQGRLESCIKYINLIEEKLTDIQRYELFEIELENGKKMDNYGNIALRKFAMLGK